MGNGRPRGGPCKRTANGVRCLASGRPGYLLPPWGRAGWRDAPGGAGRAAGGRLVPAPLACFLSWLWVRAYDRPPSMAGCRRCRVRWQAWRPRWITTRTWRIRHRRRWVGGTGHLGRRGDVCACGRQLRPGGGTAAGGGKGERARCDLRLHCRCVYAYARVRDLCSL